MYQDIPDCEGKVRESYSSDLVNRTREIVCSLDNLTDRIKKVGDSIFGKELPDPKPEIEKGKGCGNYFMDLIQDALDDIEKQIETLRMEIQRLENFA